MSKTLGLALGSGGSRGVAHIGVLKALEEEGIKPDFIAGCSMGAVVGATYAAGLSPDRMKEIALKLKTLDIVDISAAPISKLGLLRGNKMHKLLLKYLGHKTFADLEIPFTCVAVDMLSGKLYEFTEGELSVAVKASSTIPTAFRPVKLNGMLLVDGGVLCRLPTEQVKRMGADVVVAVDALVNTGEPVEKVTNIFAEILRLYDMLDYTNSAMKKKLTADTFDLCLEPEMKGLSQYSVKNLEKAFDEGYACAKENMPKIKELLK